MSRLKSWIARLPWMIVCTLLVSFGISYSWPLLLEKYDAAFPVLSMRGQLIKRDEISVFINISGIKNRDCSYAGMQSYSLNAEGERSPVYREKQGMPESGQTRPPGAYDLGTWRYWPLEADSMRVQVFVQHICSGRLITTNVADVDLHPKGKP